MCRGHAQYPAFALGTSEVAVGLWPFDILLVIIAPGASASTPVKDPRSQSISISNLPYAEGGKAMRHRRQ